MTDQQSSLSAMQRLSVLLLGGCYEHKFTTRTCDWYEWRQHRGGWLADRINKVINPPIKQ